MQYTIYYNVRKYLVHSFYTYYDGNIQDKKYEKIRKSIYSKKEVNNGLDKRTGRSYIYRRY